MPSLLLWIPLLPLASSLILGLVGRRLPNRAVSILAVGSVGASAVLAAWLSARMGTELGAPSFTKTLWIWMRTEEFQSGLSLRLDALSSLMALVVTGVGFLIHLYSTEYMEEEDGYSRFFSYMNLFVASMLVLVLADDLLLLYLGWEGVGLCSYLLIGFWYRNPENGRAARKAFLVTRIGDALMALGLFILILSLGSLEIPTVLARARSQWGSGSTLALACTALLTAGALGKSAQLPLQTWLPDAMAGPTPVSALIHAATMVTAGVYLIARLEPLFSLAPSVELLIALVGAATLLLSALSALAQTDIKRVLAYSTMSQLGLMFMALGVGSPDAAIFHLMTHAFYKALLFLAAGAVILALHHEQSLDRMGGLRRGLPQVFWPFLIGAASLAAIPFTGSGFFSKERIIEDLERFAQSAQAGAIGSVLFWAAIAGALLTSWYSFRLVFLVFLGPVRTPVTRRLKLPLMLPLLALSALTLLGGFLAPRPAPRSAEAPHAAGLIASLAGLVLAATLREAPVSASVRKFLHCGFGFDAFYERVFVRPFLSTARASRRDWIDRVFGGFARACFGVHRFLSATQSGGLRWYAAALGGAVALLIGLTEIL